MEPQKIQQQKNVFSINSTYTLKTGRKIPVIGYGTYQLKGDDCVKGVKCAIQYGYTHIDTASIYKNEEQIRAALEELKVDRSKLYITSKISPAQQGYLPAKKACNEILQKLGCKYLDLLLIHWPGVSKLKVDSKDNAKIRLQTWKALIQLQKEGKVKDIGVSNFLRKHLEHLFKNSDVKPAVNQFQIHPLLWQEKTIQLCRQHGIVIEAYSPLARQDDALFKNQMVLNIAKNHNKSVAQICLRWALQNNFVILPKSKTEGRILQNINIFDFQLSAEEMKQLTSLTSKKLHTCWNPINIVY